MELFLQLAIIIISTKIAGDVAVRLGQPSVLVEILRTFSNKFFIGSNMRVFDIEIGL